MDSFTQSIRTLYVDAGMKLSPFSFVHLWNNKYIVLCFMLLFIYSVANYPRDRIKERYIIGRIGVKKWAYGQMLYLGTFSWIYLIFLFVVNTLFMLPCTVWKSSWGNEWSYLLNSDFVIEHNVMIYPTQNILLNYKPIDALLLIFVIGGSIFTMISFLIITMNLYHKMLGSFLATGLVFLSVTMGSVPSMIRFSPVSWWNLDSHYRISNQVLPKVEYMFLVMGLLVLLFINVLKIRVLQTQEDHTGGKIYGK